MIRFFDQDGIDIAEAGPTQDRAALPPRGVPPGPGVGDRRHRVPAPGPRALHRRAERRRRRRRHRPGRVQDGARLLLRDRQLRHAQRAGQAGRRGPGGEPLRGHRRGHGQRPAAPRPSAWPTWCGPRGPTWGRSSTPAASTSPWSTTRAGSSPTTRRSCCSSTWWSPRTPARQGGPAGGGAHGGRAHLRRGRGRDRVDQAVGHPPHGGGQRRRGDLRRQPDGRLHLPALPPRLRRRGHPRPPARHAGPHRRAPVEAGEPAARRPHRPRGGRHARGSRRAR